LKKRKKQTTQEVQTARDQRFHFWFAAKGKSWSNSNSSAHEPSCNSQR
jgi:hypothetical protein